jgi:predicted nucleotidyltransferase component of viral defense system
MIPQRNLSLLANRLQREHGGRRIPEAVLERDYCLAWLLAELDATPLKDLLIFKGGTALKRCYFGDYRFSEDLDFTLGRRVDFPEIRGGLDEVFAKVTTASGINFAFESQEQAGHTNSYTFYLGYQGPLPKPNSVKVDITIEEVMVLPLEQRPVLRAYDEFEDLPGNRTLNVYSLAEIAVEKTVALSDRARNEPRDLYDLWFLTDSAGIELQDLVPAIQEKLRFRGRQIAGIEENILAKEPRLKALWTTRLGHQIAQLPEFAEVFRAVRRQLRNAKFPKDADG